MNLPELIGTEKQIKWVESLRQKFIDGINTFKKDLPIGKRPFKKCSANELREKVESAYHTLINQTSSSWWIDRRFEDPETYFIGMVKSAMTHKEKDLYNLRKEIGEEAKIESTLRPEDPITETVAEVSIIEDFLYVRFAENRRDFRKVIKKDCLFRWNKQKEIWTRKIDSFSGPIIDRCIEVCSTLLSENFIIRNFDQDIRDRIISGDFIPECRKWIKVRTEGEYKNWFAITWHRSVGDYYDEARHIPGSKYNDYAVLVPLEQWAEILDFSEINGFRLSDMAKGLVNIAKNISVSSRIVSLSKQNSTSTTGKRISLNDDFGVAEELLDHDETINIRDLNENITIDELAKNQNVKSVDNIKEIFGTWPGENEDGFEESVTELRHHDWASHDDSKN